MRGAHCRWHPLPPSQWASQGPSLRCKGWRGLGVNPNTRPTNQPANQPAGGLSQSTNQRRRTTEEAYIRHLKGGRSGPGVPLGGALENKRNQKSSKGVRTRQTRRTNESILGSITLDVQI
eukprot:5297790-Pyramimonas_sp.AAC.1